MRKTTTLWMLGMLLTLPGVSRGQDGSAVSAVPLPSPTLSEQEVSAGLALYRRLHFREAERHFRAAVEADPRSAPAHYYLAYTIYKIAEPKRPNDPGKQRAAEEFARAYELDALFVPVWQTHKR